MSERPTPAELAEETSTWLVGGGVITLALFPLALPLIALLVISALPFLIPVLALGLLVAVVALPIALVRSLGRWAARRARRRSSSHPGRLDSSGTRPHGALHSA